MANTILKKNKVSRLTLLNYKTQYKATVVIETVVLTKEEANRSVEQNREPEIDPNKYSQLTFDKGENFTLMGAGYTCILEK